MYRTITRSLLLLIFATALYAKNIPVVDVTNMTIRAKADGSQPSLAEVKEAIKKGAAINKWTVKELDEQTLEAEITVRKKHYVSVTIPYTTKKFSILFKEARNMKYDKDEHTIHPNYRKWTINLGAVILLQFME